MFISSEKALLFSFFILLILAGTALLLIPAMWDGEGQIGIVDALFTSTSAVCVTGLITLDTAQFSIAGKLVVMFLIQVGGLGIISFSTIYLTQPKKKKSFHSVNIIRGYYLESVSHDALKILKNIILFTFLFEAAGALALFFFFKGPGERDLLTAVFHSISAFCNAGFSLFSENLEGQKDNVPLMLSVMFLIFAGGIGFVVIDDIRRKLAKKKRLSIYTKLMLSSTFLLIFGGGLVYFILERNNTLEGMPLGLKAVNALFQSVTTRTAGFNTLAQDGLCEASKFATLPLMFIGGGSGSIAGGIKVSTIAIILIALFRGRNKNNDIRIGNRNIRYNTILEAFILAGKAIVLLAVCIFVLLIIEGGKFPVINVVFECFSAFGTVGLSQGITSQLSSAGKLVIVFTMFAGRVGIVSMALRGERSFRDTRTLYPEGEVLLG